MTFFLLFMEFCPEIFSQIFISSFTSLMFTHVELKSRRKHVLLLFAEFIKEFL